MNRQERVVGNFFWRLMERFGAQVVTLIVSIVLARLLDPNVYGTIALITVFTQILYVFIDSGLGSALIQKKDADDLDFSSVFIFNMVMCCSLYVILFLAAPYIAEFYGMPELARLTRVLGLTLIISGVKNVQQAYVSRNMMFKLFFFSTLGGTISAAIVGISMAYLGFGVWALVGQYVVNAGIDTLVLWYTVKWRPHLMFSWKRLKGLLSYGWKLLAVSLINTVYGNVRQLIIGKLYMPEDLAFYNKGKQFPSLFDSNINSSIDSVLLPTMAAEQDDIATIKRITRRSIKTSTFIMAPILVGLAVCGDALIGMVLTDKWLPCVPYMRIFCITFIFSPMFTANYNAFKAVGRSDMYLKVSIISKCFGVLILIASMKYGVMIMAYGLLVSNVISQLVCTYPNKHLLNYGYFEQMRDILPTLLIASIMGGAVYLLNYLHIGNIIKLGLQIITGVLLYWILAKCSRIDSYEYVLAFIQRRYGNKKRD